MSSISVAVLTDLNNLAIPLVTKLLRLDCSVDIFCKNKEFLKEHSIGKSPKLELLLTEELSEKNKYDYVVLISLNHSEGKTPDTFEELKLNCKLALQIVNKRPSKLIYIFPYLQTKNLHKQINELKENGLISKGTLSAVLYLGQILGNQVDLIRTNYLGLKLENAVLNNNVYLQKDTVFNPISENLAVRHVIKSLFSFGNYGREFSIISGGITSKDFESLLLTFDPQIKVKRQIGKKMFYASTGGKVMVKQDEDKIIKTTIKKLSKNKNKLTRTKKLKTERNTRKIGKNNPTRKKLNYFLFGIITFLFFLPSIAIFAISFTNMLALRAIYAGMPKLSRDIFNFSRASSGIAMRYTELLPARGLNNPFFSPPHKSLSLINSFSGEGIKLAEVFTNINEIYEKSFNKNDSEYNIESLFSSISLAMDSIYREQGFINNEKKEIAGWASNIVIKAISWPFKKIQAGELLELKTLADEGPVVFGSDGTKTYLVVLQNNLKLRPSGGLIEAVAFVTFSEGKISSIEATSTESIDNLLKGFVEPPEEMKKYIDPTWTLANAGWALDFPTAAQQMEWFVDKEVDRRVDGVIGVDLDFLYEVLKLTGPLNIKTFDIEIDKENFTELVGEYGSGTENGSHIFWNEVVNEIFNSLRILSKSKRVLLLHAVTKSLEERHLQVFLENIKTQKALSGLGWDASLPSSTCEGNCIADFVGLAEASVVSDNLGTSIKRSAVLSFSFEEGLIKKRYTILLENDKKDDGSIYSSYIRLVVPKFSSFSPVIIKSGKEEKTVTPQVVVTPRGKEIGALVSAEAGEDTVIQFYWESPNDLDFNKPGEYKLVLRKQAGLKTFTTRVELGFPEGVRVNESVTALTGENHLEYNTELSRDFVSRIYW